MSISSNTSRNAVVTGAGSGVGRAVAVRLAAEGWNVALVGRREDALRETASAGGKDAKRFSIHACDVASGAAVERMGAAVLARFGSVQVLVNSAGTNVPKRSLEVLSEADYRMMLGTNLDGAYYCVQAFLPGMRNAGQGTIVNIVSDAGLRASPKAGPGYVMSKFGMAGLTQAINAEERGRGVRACGIFPGDINTPILNNRPVPPSAEARAQMLQADDVADCVLLAINLPHRAVIEELVVRPR